MKITVITVCFNVGETIIATINSVLSQTYQYIEYWVIDGNSVDNTKEILQSYGNKIQLISESDTGVYNAMNKGIMRSDGEYLIFLNAGDYFKSDDVLKFMIENSSQEDIVYGNLVFVSEENEIEIKYPDTLTFSFFIHDTLPHPCTLIKRKLFNNKNLYDESLQICADWAFFIDAIVKGNCSYKHVDKTISAFLKGGLSSKPGSVSLINKEKSIYLKDNYGFIIKIHDELELFKKRQVQLQNSRMINLVTRFLPKRIRRIIYES